MAKNKTKKYIKIADKIPGIIKYNKLFCPKCSTKKVEIYGIIIKISVKNREDTNGYGTALFSVSKFCRRRC